VAICAVLTLVGLAQTLVVMDRDEGAFLVMGRAILSGRVPYRDLFDHKGPGIYYLLTPLLAATNHADPLVQLIAARSLALMADLLTAAGLYTLGKQWWPESVGILAALLWLLALPAYGGTFLYTEPFAVAPVVWAFVVVTRWSATRRYFVAGMLVGLGSLFKQTAVLALPGVWIVLWADAQYMSARWARARRTLLSLGLVIVGAALPWLAAGTGFAAAGGLGQFVAQVVMANLHYPPDSPQTVVLATIGGLAAAPMIWFVPLLVLGANLRWPGRAVSGSSWRLDTPLAALGAAGAGNLLPFSAHAFPHYWLQILPWAALLTAYGILAVLARWRSAPLTRWRRLRPWQRVLLTPTVAGWLMVTLLVPAYLLRGVPAEYNVLRLQEQAGNWIATYTPSNARLLVAPAEPQYYFLADRLPVTHYLYLLPVNLSAATLADVAGSLCQERFDVVVWQAQPESVNGQVLQLYGQTPDFYREQARTFAGVYAALTAHYHEVARDRRLGLTLFARGSPAP
jgi:hypothetical protein